MLSADISRNMKKTRISINKQLSQLLLSVCLPLLVMTASLLILLVSFNQEYTVALQNANTAAEFNNEFKHNLDLAMWYHVINAKSEAELPWGEVDHAVEVLNRLQKTTAQGDNRWRISSMLNMCGNLKKYMADIANTEYYDDRIKKLDRDIYSITKLIESYMHNYLYDEVKELARLQVRIKAKVLTTIAVTVILSALLVVSILVYSLRFTRRITQPISELSRKVEKLAGSSDPSGGDFSVEPIETRSEEIKTLDDGFNDMVRHINGLLEEVREHQTSLRRAELELLQAQINPHFLYNTLDSIIWLAEAHRNSEVTKMVSSLSVFFRNSLSSGHDVVTLEAERNHVKSYLEIQNIRYSDILEYSIDIPDTLLRYTIPKLTLQPLVENAIYHGTKNKRAMGRIVIQGYEETDAIALTVRDNGIGMSEEQLETLRAGLYKGRRAGGRGFRGLGLINVHKRIKLYCGESYGLSFESVPGEGTTVTVRIPKKIQLSP
ncbi:MAG: sensor histidine kinase [Clostridiales bacterium]|jgi:two-component system sensor histidine kinase YesM|nr:sensor histidine kinase [Clostridiales bacterium]